VAHARLRNRRGDPVREFSASEAKNAFGQVLDAAERDGMVAIRRHDRPRAVVLSLDEYAALLHARDATLAALDAEFDAGCAAMQEPGRDDAMRRALSASPEEMGRIAAKAARRKR
jgi:prevent-host-death family protein